MVVVGVAFAGLVVLAVCSVAVFRAVQRFGREVERASERLRPEHATLQDELRKLEKTGE